MRDRIPRYPGRIFLRPVYAQSGFYDMLLQDDPIEIGTQLNTANLLADSTAEKFGGNQNSTPNDIFGIIAQKLGNLRNAAKVEYGEYTGTGNPVTLTFPFDPKLVIILTNAIDSEGSKYVDDEEIRLFAFKGMTTAMTDLKFSSAGESHSTYLSTLSWGNKNLKITGQGMQTVGTKYYYAVFQ